MINIEP